MDMIKSYFWITLALCVATGGCDVFYKQSGGSVLMNCAAKPSVDIEWKHKGVRIVIQNVKSGRTAKGQAPVGAKAKLNINSLDVPMLKNEDSGEYTCNEAQHTLRVVSAFASPPDVVLGSETKLHCDVFEGSNEQFQWFGPDNKRHSTSGKEVTLKSVNDKDAGSWSCSIRDGTGKEVTKLGVVITVIGPLVSSDEIKVRPGGDAELPCRLPKTGRPRVKKVDWSRNPATPITFPIFDPQSLTWNNTASKSRFFCSDQPLSSNFSITLTKVQHVDAAEYSCTVHFDNGQSLSTKMKLTVEGEPVVSVGSSGSQRPVKNIWHKPVLGVGLWIWLAVGASSLVLIVLVVATVLMYRRNKRMKRKIKKSLRPVSYCQCERPVVQPGPRQGRKQRPPPLPRQQYSTLHDYNDAA